MKDWIAVVTDPLGFAGFALFLVFSLLALRGRPPQPRWVAASFVIMAVVGLVGGLGLGYLKQQRRPELLPAQQPGPNAQSTSETSPTPVVQPGTRAAGLKPRPSSPAANVRQETHGAQSPAVSGVQGNVTISIQSLSPEDLKSIAALVHGSKSSTEAREPSVASPTTTNRSGPQAQRVTLVLQYAYEWNYRGAKNAPGDTVRPIDAQIPLRKKLANGPHRLDLGVYNANMRPLESVLLTVQFPKGLEITRAGSWIEMFRNSEYQYRFGEVDNDLGLVADYPLFLTFPHLGSFRVDYCVKVRGLPCINGDFTMILEKDRP